MTIEMLNILKYRVFDGCVPHCWHLTTHQMDAGVDLINTFQ